MPVLQPFRRHVPSEQACQPNCARVRTAPRVRFASAVQELLEAINLLDCCRTRFGNASRCALRAALAVRECPGTAKLVQANRDSLSKIQAHESRHRNFALVRASVHFFKRKPARFTTEHESNRSIFGEHVRQVLHHHMLDGTCKNATAVSDSARAIANGIFKLVDDLRVIQNVMAIGGRMIRFVQDFVALRIDNIKFRQCIAMHGTCDKTHIVRVFRFN